MIRDLRLSIRTLLHNPAFTIVAVLTLALGIAANTSIFSAVDAVLLHPLPFSHADQLVDVTKTMPRFGLFQSVSSPLDFLDYRSRAKVFSQMAAVERAQFNLTGDFQPERRPGMRVSADLFPMLGVTPILGRTFTPEDEQWGRHKVVILGEPLWRGRFGADPQILGKQLQLDGESYTVIGVSKSMLAFLGRSELWTPLAFEPDQLAPNQRGRQYLDILARLKPGKEMAAAQADLKLVAAQMSKDLPTWYPGDWSIDASPLSARVSGPVRTPLLVLLGAVALVLLIGCVNVSNLLLARASGRQKEITIRTALGAARSRIIRQLLLESAAIAVVSGAFGLLASVWILDLFERLGPAGLLSGQHLGMNLPVAIFTVLISLTATLVFGLVPAITASKVDLNDTLKESSRAASASAGKRRLRETLVASEVALSLMLLIAAGLLIRSLTRLQAASPGFAPQHLATLQISLPVVDYREPAGMASFYDQLITSVRSIPGVSAVGAVSSLPFSGSNRGGDFNIIGRTWLPSQAIPDVAKRSVSAGYFQTMQAPLLGGRGFLAQDGPDAPKVVVVDQPFAKQFFAREDPIGKQLSGPGNAAYTIVGVVGGIKHSSLSTPPAPTIYYSALQAPERTMFLVIRTSLGDPLGPLPFVRSRVAALDRNLPVARVSTMEQLMADSLARTRFSTTLLAAFATLALLLAAIGMYGVISYTVTQRGQEIGIRMALGARPHDAVILVMRQGAIPVLAGILAGLAMSLAGTRALGSLLFGVSPTDPLTFAGLSLLLAAVAFAAIFVPARRAARLDPIVALRYE